MRLNFYVNFGVRILYTKIYKRFCEVDTFFTYAFLCFKFLIHKKGVWSRSNVHCALHFEKSTRFFCCWIVKVLRFHHQPLNMKHSL